MQRALFMISPDNFWAPGRTKSRASGNAKSRVPGRVKSGALGRAKSRVPGRAKSMAPFFYAIFMLR